MDISVEETIKVANDAVICSKHFRNSSQYLNFPTTPNASFNLNFAEEHCSGNKGRAYIKLKYLISLS
jgi:hypothetical protein